MLIIKTIKVMKSSALVEAQDQLREELVIINKTRWGLEEQKNSKLTNMFTEKFNSVLGEGDVIEASDARIHFKRPQEGVSYNREVLDLYLRNDDYRVEEANVIQTSFYSTSENSEFELRRMVLIGNVGQILLNSSDELIEGYNQIKSEFKDVITANYKEMYGVEKQITEIENEIRGNEKQSLLNKIENEGIEFEIGEDKSINCLPNFDAKVDLSIYNVKALQVLNKTASGKTADVRLKIMSNDWNSETQSYNEREIIKIVSRVRMNNILQFIQYNQSYISAS
tara:strand:+ start:3120 stop:3965 length:846 start_codon:yes stop_codon:yes gene_type:complete